MTYHWFVARLLFVNTTTAAKTSETATIESSTKYRMAFVENKCPTKYTFRSLLAPKNKSCCRSASLVCSSRA